MTRYVSVTLSPLPLGYAAVVVPIVTIHLCFIISVIEGHFSFCIPYWADCISVSRTGRLGSSYFIFKAGMLPAAILFFIYWQLNRVWLNSYDNKRHYALFWLPACASIALLIYSLALGHTGDAFYLLRRFGVVFFMFCTFISQVILGNALAHTKNLLPQGRRLILFSAVMLAIAIFSLLLDTLMGELHDRFENAFEWWLIMLLIVHVFLCVRLWQKTGFGLRVIDQRDQ